MRTSKPPLHRWRRESVSSSDGRRGCRVRDHHGVVRPAPAPAVPPRGGHQEPSTNDLMNQHFSGSVGSSSGAKDCPAWRERGCFGAERRGNGGVHSLLEPLAGLQAALLAQGFGSGAWSRNRAGQAGSLGSVDSVALPSPQAPRAFKALRLQAPRVGPGEFGLALAGSPWP